SVRSKSEGPDPAAMAAEAVQLLAREAVPQADPGVSRSGGPEPAVRREGHGRLPPVAPLERSEGPAFGSRRPLPEVDIALAASRGEHPSVGREGQGSDRLSMGENARPRRRPVALCRQVPEAKPRVVGPRGQGLAVGRKTEAANTPLGTAPGTKHLSRDR